MRTRRLVPSFDALPPEAKKIADNARQEMDDWIDEKVEALADDMTTELSKGVALLQAQVSEIESELAESRKSMEAILGQITKLQQDITLGDGAEINKAIELTQQSVEKVKTELANREAKWKALGNGIVDQVSGAIGKVIPISI
ncbi:MULTISPECIES: hypothetical protein [Alteromonadaceae]|uniref:hypothetical protein n=1 Tax=Alteromonadaceae TaxID=72275 RepID=UPI001C096771|nr:MULTISPECIES: hypothetical protein [Aliiglaciecola]MBU2880222.1 hypothetical protein [Aliiglaciecola lipolytica]MDO6713236.1 hypothetical protein [Aliiglaciecola sp. 2_MG-2023]MDO6754326.1 hypothetical protein [Aliiglaciecola sp. 1_MG-2023]